MVGVSVGLGFLVANSWESELTSDGFVCPEDYPSFTEYINEAARWSSEYLAANPNATTDDLLKIRKEQFDAHNCSGRTE